jgi:hypothetical protein
MSTAPLPHQASPQIGTIRSPGSAGNSPRVEHPHDEQIAEITDRLQRRYPTGEISPADLEGRVRGFHRQFDTARIRTFVAVFVERLVRRSIETPSAAL